ncbi:melanoma-associated antigen B3-like [Acomys russatus]|uniref:melanoma-associated antigen B3-like n=1 Tax=Acomys russatus TaxID=60746 RepID=UPI0021E1FA73|nr:melanoma-associated antigen B3-like [Acomys russatus]
MPRGQKSKLNACGRRRHRRRRAQNSAQASESSKETIEAEKESSPESCGASEISDDDSISRLATLILACDFSDESSIDDLDEESFFCYHHSINRQNILARKVILLLQMMLDNYKTKQLTTMEDIMQVIDEKEIDVLPEILREVSERLADIFAVELREVESSRGAYDLISKLKLPNNGRVRAGKGFPKTGFVMTILGLIILKGNCAREEDIWTTLKSIGVYPGKKHRIFGEPRKLMTQYLVKLQYLEYRQVANSDPPRYEFLWGPQAYAETSKKKVLEFLARINELSSNYTADFYEEILKEDQGKN